MNLVIAEQGRVSEIYQYVHGSLLCPLECQGAFSN